MTEIPKVAAPPRDAVFTAELADLMGVKSATIKHYTSQASKGWPQGRNRAAFRLPDGRSLITVDAASTPGQPTRKVWAPWWHRETVDLIVAGVAAD